LTFAGAIGVFTGTGLQFTQTGPQYYANWFAYDAPPATTGSLLRVQDSEFGSVVDLTFANSVHPDRRATMPGPVVLNAGLFTITLPVQDGIKPAKRAQMIFCG
jgi:hypothetical protein